MWLLLNNYQNATFFYRDFLYLYGSKPNTFHNR